jgi:predicted dehydrogenase
MADRIRWGILGTGRVSAKFVEGLHNAPGAEVRAVGSRSPETAKAFADRFEIPVRHVSYEDLAGDPSVDVIYVGTPHSCHYRDTVLASQSGKPVLVEKPFMLNAAQAEGAVALARDKKVFLMEAMWTRFLPLMEGLRGLLHDHVIGELHLLSADLGIRRTPESRPRLFDLSLGGGALLDTGVYPVSLSSLLLGVPERIVSMAKIGSYGVDERAAMLFEFRGGALAVLYCAIRTETPKEAMLMGEMGHIRLHANFVHPTQLTLTLNEGAERVMLFPMEGNGLQYEAVEVMRCLREGCLESPRMPLDESVSIMRTLDEIRAQWGLKYPGES